MIDRQTTYYYIGLAVLCTIVVVGVVFFLKPRMETKLPAVSQVSASAQSGRLQKRDITDGTRDIMQTKYKDRNNSQSLNTNRNPFIWYGEIGPKKNLTGVPKSVPELGMIIIGQKRRIAFLDKKLVYEGKEHGGYRVERIAPKAVTISNAYGRLQLIAPEDHFGRAQVKRLERSRP